jgi:ribosomal protein S18 acetylase RimI-like enzyme
MIIRHAQEKVISQLWEMMRDLAVFEQYIDSFKITEAIILERGFQKNPPDFYTLVAATEDTLMGMLVYYFLPYTATAQKVIYMKELFVKEEHRSKKVGEQLMKALAQEARKNDCTAIKWNVAPWNAAGIRFYERLGSEESKTWLNFELNEHVFSKLANE